MTAQNPASPGPNGQAAQNDEPIVGPIEWGPKIAVNGSRPNWLRDRDSLLWKGAGTMWFGAFAAQCKDWSIITMIRLTVDHPQYVMQHACKTAERLANRMGGTFVIREITDIPQWAFDEADRRAACAQEYRRVLAQHIATHETPPVDEATALFQSCLDAFLKQAGEEGPGDPVALIRDHLAKVRRERSEQITQAECEEAWSNLLKADRAGRDAAALLRELINAGRVTE